MLLDGLWQATISPLDGDKASRPGFSHDAWLEVPVPAHWQQVPDLTTHTGTLWYRREFDLEPLPEGAWARLTLEGTFYRGRVWLNGTFLGEHEGYLPAVRPADRGPAGVNPAPSTRASAAGPAIRQVLAVLGDPVAHSLSPAMHNAAFASRGLNAVYLALRVEAPQLGAALAGARAMGFRGLNLTVPHKEAVLALLDEVEDRAARVGAVNTVAFSEDGRAVGYNTDGSGFLWSLRQRAGFDPTGCRALVAGAGGAARAVVAALAEAGAERVDVVNRTPSRAEAMLDALARAGFAHRGQALEAGRVAGALSRADLVVNCTTRGLWPDVDGMPPLDPAGIDPAALVVDTIYNPRPTRWLAAVAHRGCRAIDGLGMLAGQAALAWEAWFGEAGPAPEMLAVAERTLAGMFQVASNTVEHGPAGRGGHADEPEGRA